MTSKKGFLHSRINSFKYAFNGLKLLFSNEPNFRIHIAFTIGAICLSIFLNLTQIEWILILLAIGLVLICEVFNTLTENLCNLISTDNNKTIGTIKDIAAAGVLISSVISATIGTIIFIPKLYKLLF